MVRSQAINQEPGSGSSGHGSRWGSTPRITMLANASSKLLLLLLLLVVVELLLIIG
jgi:hypothetical protein